MNTLKQRVRLKKGQVSWENKKKKKKREKRGKLKIFIKNEQNDIVQVDSIIPIV